MMRFIFLLVLAALVLPTVAAAQEKYLIGTTEVSLNAANDFASLAQSQLPSVEFQAISGVASAGDLPAASKEGIVQIAVVPAQVFPATDVLQQPFASADAAGIRRIIGSETGAFVTYRLEQEGFVVLDFWQLGFSAIGTTTPVGELADLEGKKIRTAISEPGTETLQALGVSPVAVPFGEVFLSLQTGLADGSVIPYGAQSQALGLNEVVSNYVARPFRANLFVVVVPRSVWDDMPIETQTILAASARDIGLQLGDQVQADADAFRTSEIERGAQFTFWTQSDVDRIAGAAIQFGGGGAAPDDADVARRLVQTAYFAGAPQQEPAFAADDGLPEGTAEVYFATDRQRSNAILGLSFNAKRARSDISFGTAQIKLKAGRRFSDDLIKGTEITEVTTIEDDIFLNATLESIRDSGGDLVVFVHGYNNTFADALMRSGTIAVDLADQANVLVYSWPSDGHAVRYGYDESSASSSTSNFINFMRQLTDVVPSERISIVAHSMGSRLVVGFIESLQIANIDPADQRFANFVFAASDIGRLEFLQVEDSAANPNASALSMFADAVTIYVSEFDGALGLSSLIHSDIRVGRAARPDMIDDEDMVTIDASLIDPVKLLKPFPFVTRHSYVFDKPEGVTDLASVLAGAMPSARTGLLPTGSNSGIWWMPGPQ